MTIVPDKSFHQLLNRMEDYLFHADFFLIPVEKIYNELIDKSSEVTITIDEVIDAIKKDERFKLFLNPQLKQVGRFKSMVSHQDLEKTGFYEGPRVMLLKRVPTQHEIIRFLLKKADQTFEALKKAWDIRPEGDEEIEDQLLEALAKSQKLQREFNEILSREDSHVKEKLK